MTVISALPEKEPVHNEVKTLPQESLVPTTIAVCRKGFIRPLLFPRFEDRTKDDIEKLIEGNQRLLKIMGQFHLSVRLNIPRHIRQALPRFLPH